MKITAVSVYRLNLPLVGGEYVWAKGKRIEVADITLVRIDTDEGLTGWGETCPLGANYLPSYPDGIRTGVSFLAPLLLGRDPTRVGAISRAMDFAMRGQPYVKSAIDVACWDLLGKSAGLPVHALLGGRQMDAMPMYRSVSQTEPERMRDSADQYRAQGYTQFQLKVGCLPEDDIKRIRAVVEAKKENEIVLCDANTGWRRDEALRVAQGTSDLDYIYEQPCELYSDCLSVRRRAKQLFKLDESLQTEADLLRALNDDAMDIACIKISKMGGLSRSRLARDLCAASGIPMTVEDVWGSDVVTAALAHLAVSTPPEFLLNTTDLHNYQTTHFADGAPDVKNGKLLVSDEPGLGVTPDEQRLGEPVAVYR